MVAFREEDAAAVAAEELVAADRAVAAGVHLGELVERARHQAVRAALARLLGRARAHHAQQPPLLVVEQAADAAQRDAGGRRRVRRGERQAELRLDEALHLLAAGVRPQHDGDRGAVDRSSSGSAYIALSNSSSASTSSESSAIVSARLSRE